MSDNKKQNGLSEKEKYFNSSHRVGRIGIIGAIIVLLAMPTILGIYFDAMPSLGDIISSSAGLLAIFLPIGITEVISYTPIFGSSIYLTLVTGEVTGLKLPAATNAMKIMDIEYGTEDADVISGIAVSASTFVVVIIVTLGTLLMIPLEPLLTSPAVETATSNLAPALFGAIGLSFFTDDIGGGIKAKGRLKGIVLPLLILSAITIANNLFWHIDALNSAQGIFIIVLLPIAYFGTKLLYKKGKIQVTLPEERK